MEKREGLLTTTSFGKTDKRGRSSATKSSSSSKSSLFVALLSCIAWLYIAGRLKRASSAVLNHYFLDLRVKKSLVRSIADDKEFFIHRPQYYTMDDRILAFSQIESFLASPNPQFNTVDVRLWQDAENRMLLANLFQKSSNQRPKVLTVEDKLVVLGCKDLERRIVEAEMELTLAKSQGYLNNQLQQSGSSSGKRLLAVIGVYTGFGSRLKRNVFRGSWMPKGDALKKLEERGVVIRFVIGRSANRGDSLDRSIDEENRKMKDFLILDGHEEAEEEFPKKAKFFFSTAVQKWDADFYVKVDDNINLDLDAFIEFLESRHSQDSAYIGCMKSGEVVAEEGRRWYEPDWWKFGDEKTYFRHAAGSLLILSKNFAQYININSASLKMYAHDDISVGSWMMGLQATYIDDSRLCCSNSRQDKVCYLV